MAGSRIERTTKVAPPPRRRMRAPERRAQLLGVARRVFGTSGFHSASMDEVAEQAGVTKPILYDHFPSKRDLYLALLDEDLSRLHDMIQRALASPEGNRERIRGSFQAYFDFVDAQADGFRLLMQESVGTEKAFRDRVHRFRDQVLREVADLIVRESGGNLDRDRAEAVALALIGMVENVAQRNPGASARKRREAVDTLVQLAWRGIAELTPGSE
jgi:AcrR family transcriptional regulator